MSDLIPIRDSKTRIDTGRSAIAFAAPNLLDNQIMQALKNCVENASVNDILLLQHLEAIANGQIKL